MSKILFDSHTHINDESLSDSEREALIQDIEASDILYVMDIGANIPMSKLAVEDSKKLPGIYAAVGVHPSDTLDMTEEDIEILRELSKDEKVKAIGEIGLDFHYDDTEPVSQEKWFREQIRLANELKMPISIHSRDADQKTMDILKEEGAFSKERKAFFPKRMGANGLEDDARVLLHCFSGSSELAKEYVKLGATISIAGPVTYKNNRKTREVVETIPLEYLLVETDAPYLTPEPHRGEKNKAPFVEFTARKVAEIKGLSYEEVAKKTLENGKHFFDIK